MKSRGNSDVALRGPWLSGGIEFNFGIIGHSPSTSTPIDWFTRENGDGSVSCFVASDEYITRTRWQVEVRLGADADEFETRVAWYNSSGLPAPYYHWMNAAYSLRHDPEFLFPGVAAVGHEGEIVTRTWPLDAKGRAPALGGPVAGVFPFRRESRPALEAAAASDVGWKARYLCAVLLGFFRARAAASTLLESCGNIPDEAVFYVYRARMRQGAARLADLMRAREIGDSWRIGRDMITHYEAAGNFGKMLECAKDYLDRFPEKNPLQIAYARALQKLGHHRECMAYLEGVKILPSEHRDSATDIWQACQTALGLPLPWPENLGKGEPYHDGEWRQKG